MSISNITTIQTGDTVLFAGKNRKTFLRTVQPDQSLQTHFGEIFFKDIIGIPYGEQVRTHMGHSMYVLQPNIEEIILNLHRETQIMYPKDMGYVVTKMNLVPGAKIIEAGTGSGGFTLLSAFLVGGTGHVYSYDNKRKHQKLAQRHAQRMGVSHRVTFYERDITDGFDQRDVNAVFLDVQEPSRYVDQAREALRGGGFLGAIVPTVNQVEALLSVLYKGAWFLLQVEEILLRQWKTLPTRIRPDDQMVAHTGFLVFARAVNRDTEVDDEVELAAEHALEDTQPIHVTESEEEEDITSDDLAFR